MLSTRYVIRRMHAAVVATLVVAVLAPMTQAQTGACCIGTSCSLRTLSSCDNAGGDWRGPGTNCSGNPCGGATLGACCDIATLQCTATTPSGCTGNRAFLGLGVSCTPNSCLSRGGCCNSTTLTCTLTTSGACDSGRVFLGAGRGCSPSTPCAILGACCEASGPSTACRVTIGTDCVEGGIGLGFQGIGTTCSANACMGACCFDGSTACSIASGPSCSGLGDDYQGNGVACSPTRCSNMGACCGGNPGSCRTTDRSNCGSQPQSVEVFQGEGTTCGTSGNPTTCCPANFNQQGGVTVQDIFDFLAAYFGGQSSADFNQSMTVTVQDIFDYLAAYFAGCS